MEWSTHSAVAATMKFHSKVHQSDEKIGQMKMFKLANEAVPAVNQIPCHHELVHLLVPKH